MRRLVDPHPHPKNERKTNGHRLALTEPPAVPAPPPLTPPLAPPFFPDCKLIHIRGLRKDKGRGTRRGGWGGGTGRTWEENDPQWPVVIQPCGLAP